MGTRIRKFRLLGAFIILTLFILLTFTVNTGNLYAQEECRKTILVLHSYNHDLKWTDDQHLGFKRALEETAINYQLFVEHMDWKNYFGEDSLNIFKDLIYHKYSEKNIDVVYATDDAALDFTLKYRDYLFPEVPVVFSGVYELSAMSIISNRSYVRGVFEDIDPMGTLKAAQALNPGIKNVYYIHDGTESGSGSLLTVTNSAHTLGLSITDSGNTTMTDILNTVSKLGNTYIVLLGSYTVGADGTVHTPQHVVKKISEASAVPVYHLYDFMYRYGTVGGSLLRGELQGYEAGKLAEKFFQGEDISNISFYNGKTTELIFDYHQLERHGLPQKQLPAGSIVENEPFSFYETYKDLVIKTAALILVLLVSIVVLINNINKRKKVEEELRLKNEELSQLYEEITASEEELRANYEELLCHQQQLKESRERDREKEEIIRKMAYEDALTGLPNRAYLLEETNKAISEAIKQKEMAGLIFLDINNFKNINDTFGHTFGDKVLKMAALRITSMFGGTHLTVARLGGDEFVIFTRGEKEEIINQAEKVLSVFKNPMKIEEHLLHLSVSAGISLAPDHGITFEELIKYADTAMYKAKAKGKGNYLVFNKTMLDELLEKITIERGLREALEKEQFLIHYQPQIELKKNRPVGFEALVRWCHPTKIFRKYFIINLYSNLCVQMLQNNYIIE